LGTELLSVPHVARERGLSEKRVGQLIRGQKTSREPLPAVLVTLNGRGAWLVSRGGPDAWHMDSAPSLSGACARRADG